MLRTGLLVLALVGCGGHGATVDAGVDAKTAITVEVAHYDGSPAAGADVVFQDVTGAVVVATNADASGMLTIDMMPTIAMVTAMVTDAGSVGVETIVGIEPGDELELVLPGGAAPPPPMKIATLAGTFPPNAPPTTDTWEFDAICQSTSGATAFAPMLDINHGCQGSDTMLAVAAIASAGTTPLAFSTTTVQVAASGNTTVIFPDGWRTDFISFQQTFTNAPAGTIAIRPTFTLEVNGGNWFPFGGMLLPSAAGAGTMQSYQYPPSFVMGGTYGIEAHFSSSSPIPVSLWQSIDETIPASDSRDLSMLLLPEITSTSVSATTVRPQITWSAVGPMQGATFGSLDLSWPTGSWRMVVPPSTASPVQIPALPDSLAAYRPPVDGSVSSTPSVDFESDSYDADYNAARQKHATIPKTYEWRDTENPY